METIGERTLETLVAFTAMRLEFYWQRTAVENMTLDNLRHVKNKQKLNQLESALDSLVH